MNEVKTKNEFLEVDLMESSNTIKEIIEETTTKIEFLRDKMLFIIYYLDIRINEETQENIKKDKLIEFYDFLKNEINSLYNSRLGNSFHDAQTGTLGTSLSLKVTTNELIKYNINFSMSINYILASITAQENLIILK
ncbi:hypothetical protein [Fusobacterium nucleatum]|uniref:hypothetical protein n=1 Tax=Fusobacterium nucleatum TaxID=851 RepID=UPI0030CB33A6